MRSMVEGHVRCIVSFIRNAAPPVPLHHLRWSPSPFQGGSAAIGRYRPFPSRNLRPQAAATCPPLALKGIESTTHHSSRSEEHTSELQSLMRISYAVFCLKKKTNKVKTI